MRLIGKLLALDVYKRQGRHYEGNCTDKNGKQLGASY